MEIAVLSRNPGIYSTRRLAAAGSRAGLGVRVLDPFQFSILSSGDRVDLTHRDRPPPQIDGIIPRLAASSNPFGLAVLRQFEERGVIPLNGSDSIFRCRDKFRTIRILSRHGIRVPPTALAAREEDLLPGIGKVGGLPVILKVLEGSQGRGVFLAETEGKALSIFRSLNRDGACLLIQRFVSECRGMDLRAFVVGGEVAASMRRTAVGGEFRSNVHLGGRAVAARLPREFAGAALRAARVMGLEVAGVDLLESEGGALVLEVNSSPGLQRIEEVTGVDLAGRMVDALIEAWRGRERVSA